MNRFVRYGGQAAVYAVIAVLIGWFANGPAYERVAPENAVIKLSLVHGGKRGGCRERTPEELAKFIVFLCSPLAAYCIGSSYYFDGGVIKSVL